MPISLKKARSLAAMTSLSAAALTLCACTTVSLPNIDFMRLPEFRESVAKLIEGYPEASDAPTRPDDIRSAAEWDAAARSLIAQRERLSVPMDGAKGLTEAELDAEVDRLKAQIRRYKLDDPQ